MDRKFVLPILLGISLTTLSCVSLAFLYSVFEKDDETRDDNDNTKRSLRIVTSRCTTVQYKVPKQFAAAIIGRGGSVIKDIQDKTGTHITMNKDDIESPDRICFIRGNEMEGIRLAESMIKNIIDNQPVIEIYELFVPYETCKKALRRNTVQQIQRSSGAKLIIESVADKSEAGRIIIKGTAEQIALAVTQTEDKLREENEAQAQLKCQQAAPARIPRLPPIRSSIKDTMNNLLPIDKLTLPYTECERIIERNGNFIQELQRISGAEITIEEAHESEDNEKRIAFRGTVEQVGLALAEFRREVFNFEEDETDSNDELATTTRTARAVEPSPNSGVNASNILKTSEISSSKDDVIMMEVYVSAVDTPNAFWIHVIGSGIRALDNLVSEMTEYYNKEENRKLHALKKVTSGQMVAAKFSYDNRWYRAEVIDIVEDSQCEVYFMDYGDVETLSTDNVLELCTDMLSLRLQAVECSLANTKPRGNKWSSEACDKFAELVHEAQWKGLVAKIRGYKERPIDHGKSRRKGSPIPCIDLYDKDGNKIINIRKALIHLELAQFEEEVCLTVNSQDKRDLRTSILPSPSAEHVSKDCRSEADFTVSTCKND